MPCKLQTKKVKSRYSIVQVVEGWTGHTEVVRVTYDQTKTSYKSMCNIFWASHDPTSKEYLVLSTLLAIFVPPTNLVKGFV